MTPDARLYKGVMFGLLLAAPCWLVVVAVLMRVAHQ